MVRIDGRLHRQANYQQIEVEETKEQITGLYGEDEVREMAQRYCLFCQFRNDSGGCVHNLCPITTEGKPCIYFKLAK